MAVLGFGLFIGSVLTLFLGVVILIGSLFNNGIAKLGRNCLLVGALMLLASFALCSTSNF